MYMKTKFLVLAATAAAMFLINTPLRAAESEDTIESAFHKTYVYKTYLESDEITLDAEDGAVTLSGTVANESHKTLAENTVENLPGVVRVDNQLTTESEESATNADAWIGTQVKLVLMFHRHVSGIDTKVAVQEGIVTLTGEADNLAQKELTAQYANDVEGVKAVKNEMTVATAPKLEKRTVGEKIDDASIAAQVKTALLTHRSSRSISTKVVVRQGEVTLTGIAKNAADKALVTKIVDDIHGVTGVNNEMTVGAATTQ